MYEYLGVCIGMQKHTFLNEGSVENTVTEQDTLPRMDRPWAKVVLLLVLAMFLYFLLTHKNDITFSASLRNNLAEKERR